jgi:sensor histidine kinase YesM
MILGFLSVSPRGIASDNTSQQETFWQFIVKHLLTKELTLERFEEDLKIQLKGTYTTGDSLFLSQCITSLRPLIETVKIELVNKNGNLIFDFSEDKISRSLHFNLQKGTNQEGHLEKVVVFFVANKTNDQNSRNLTLLNAFVRSLISSKTDFPTDPNFSRRAILNGNKPFYNRKPILNPLDSFVLSKLYSKDIEAQLATRFGAKKNKTPDTNLKNANEQTYWEILRSKFINGNNTIDHFKEDIRLQLYGQPTREDSAYIINLTDELNKLMETSKIKLVPDKGNFVLTIDHPARTGQRPNTSERILPGGTIDRQVVALDFGTESPQSKRNQYIAYYLLKGLVKINSSSNPNTYISGAIFEERNPENTFFHELDKFIISKIYAADFLKQLKENYPGDSIKYFEFRNPGLLPFIRIAIFLSFFGLFLVFYIKKRVFEVKADQLKIYFKQGVLLLLPILLLRLVNMLIWISRLGIFEAGGFHFQIISSALLMFLSFLIDGTLVICLMYLIERIVFKSAGFKWHLLLIFVTSLTITSLFFGYSNFLLSHTLPSNFSNSMAEGFIYQFLFATIRTGYLFLNYKTRQTIRKKDIELTNLEKLKQHAELQALHSRINPHFLYNSLNSIASLAHSNADKTEQMALSLSDFCRSAINKQNKDMATISEEINMVTNYLEIEKLRLGERLKYEINTNDQLQDIEVPRFLLQPLVENAIKHGISKITGDGFIRLKVTDNENKLLIAVYDNGPAFPNDLISGYGLQSLFDKLEILYQGKASLNWENGPEKCICVTLPFKTLLPA